MDSKGKTNGNKPQGQKAPEQKADNGAASAKVSKSIVPAKYAGKYTKGGSDELAKFINGQSSDQSGFVFASFFELCKKNGIAADQVQKYADQVAAKQRGSEGRARMTLRNMLATIARKNGKLVGLDGKEVSINLPKAAVSGAAAKAQESAGQQKAA